MAQEPKRDATLEDIAGCLRAKDDFVICGHISPDGDCIGAQLALACALRGIGKRVACVRAKPDELDSTLMVLPGAEEIVAATEVSEAHEVFIAVDAPNEERLGDAACLLERAAFSIKIDHHAADGHLCDIEYVDPSAPAAAAIVWQLSKMLGAEGNADVAHCCYYGLMTDTGGFRYQNALPCAFEAAAEMVAFGAEPARAAVDAYQNRSLQSLELEALTIERMELVGGERGVVSWICEKDMRELGAAKADAELLVDALRSIKGIRVACMLREQDGAVRGSLRAKDDTNVAVIARSHGGGGHDAAAGFTLEMELHDAVELMKAEIAEAIGTA